MFQLFKKRNFSELVGDTFTFFKMHGKHYYRNYFIINGGILLVLLILVYLLMKIFFEGMFSNPNAGIGNIDSNMDLYISDNLPLIIGLAVLTGLAAIFLSLLSYSYPVAYLKLLEKKSNFETSEIITMIKSKIGKIFIFFIASLFIMIPVMAIVMLLSFALVFLLIGIPLLFILIPAFGSWFSLSFYDYISTDNGYFDSLGNGFKLLKQKFWPCVGSTVVMYMIVQIVVGIVSMIPYFIGIFSLFTSFENQDGNQLQPEQFSFFMIMFGVTMTLSILMNFVLQNFILVNQGIIYYSVREENENNTQKSEIDLIGTPSE
ncbi:hypothetical protein ABGT15_06830 [Flavobacterium enshiense]|uniref:hypothetical protein n=1 Tax=Flavobacterium enshiense TaxID=1341165 RepID=UPI00345CE2E1